uniref:Uncharacterized protein n=1 Tax=Rhizophora mucronata TaxID=61149 RepID=A0A2P2NC52_RHIMU
MLGFPENIHNMHVNVHTHVSFHTCLYLYRVILVSVKLLWIL